MSRNSASYSAPSRASSTPGPGACSSHSVAVRCGSRSTMPTLCPAAPRA